MFTGIVAAIGRIVHVESLGPDAAQSPAVETGVRLTIESCALDLGDVILGDSIAVNGACMTVVEKKNDRFFVDVSRESLARTAGLDVPGEVNLEKALRLADRIGGHLMTGHVDGIGQVTYFAPVGESHELVVRAPRALGKYLAYKGSITVNGVSLTVNRVSDTPDGVEFSINLIPHTIAATTLKHLAPGASVNLEIDLIARYVERMMSADRESD